MKVLIIGASGMLPKPVIQHLDKAGFKLRLFSRNVTQSMFDKNYEKLRGDVFNRNKLDIAMDGKAMLPRKPETTFEKWIQYKLNN